MKRNVWLGFVAATVLGIAGQGLAATIYFDDFTGTGGLNGKAPDVRPASETWTAPTNFTLSGGQVTGGPSDGSAYLPFTPSPGYTYTLTAKMSGSVDGGSWAGLGFIQSFSTGQFQDTSPWGPDAAPWILNRHYGESIGFFGPGASDLKYGPVATASNAELSIVLDTTTPAWSVTFFTDSINRGTFTYAVNPVIVGVGFADGGSGAATTTVEYFRLEGVPIPEPTTAGVILMLGLAVLTRVRA